MLRIKEKRKKLNLTQQVLADRLGITREYISLLENGHCYPSRKLLKQVAVELRTDVNDLVCEELNPEVLVPIGKTVPLEEKTKTFKPSAVGCKDGILIRDYARILTNSCIKIGQDKLFSWLHSRGYIYRDKGLDQWMAYKKYVDMDIFRVSQTKINTNKYGNKISVTIKITGKGQLYFYEELKTQYLLN